MTVALEEVAALDSGPYKFFDYFVESDVTKFAGREQDVAEVVARITRDPTLVLYGRSGLGKTSLLLAGVFPHLRTRGFHPILVRTLDNPLIDFRNAVAGAVGLPPEDTTADIPELLKAATVGHEAGVVVVCDQFEEFFIRQRKNPADRRAFIDRIAAFVEDPRIPLKVLFSLREDFLAEMDDFKVAMPEILGNTYRLLPLTAYGARQAIIAPLQQAGIKFDQRLVAKLVDLLAPDFDPLLLQIACTETYREAVRRHGGGVAELTEADLDALGGLDGLFGRYLQLALGKLPQGHIVLGRAILDALITYEDTKRAVTIDTLMENDTFSASNEEIGLVLQCLERQRLVRMDHRGDKDWYELSHERLVKSILNWFRDDKDFSNFREVRDTIANAARREYRTRLELLLGADQIREVVHPYRQRLRLTETQREFMFWSSLYRRFEGVQFWAEQFGLERCRDVVLMFFTDARPEARLGAASTAGALGPSVPLADACLDAAMNDSDANVRRAAGRSLVALAGPDHITRLKGLLANRRTRKHALDLLADLHGSSAPVKSVSLYWQWRGRVRLRRRQFRREHEVLSRRTRRGAVAGLIAALGWVATSGVALVCGWIWVGGYYPWTTNTRTTLLATGFVALLFGPVLGALLGRSGARRAVIHGREATWLGPILSISAPFLIVTGILAVSLAPVDVFLAIGAAVMGFALLACVVVAAAYGFVVRSSVWPPKPDDGPPLWSLMIGFGPPLLGALFLVWAARLFAPGVSSDNVGVAQILWLVFAIISFVATVIPTVLTETVRVRPVGEIPPVEARRRRLIRATLVAASMAVVPAYLLLFGRDSIPFAAPRYTIPAKAVSIRLKANQPDSAYFRLRPAGGGWHLIEMPPTTIHIALNPREVLRGGTPSLLYVPAGGVTLSATRPLGAGPERAETVLSISGLPELADGQTLEVGGTKWTPFTARLIEQPAKSGFRTWRAELNLRLKPDTFSSDAVVRIGLPAQRGAGDAGMLVQQFSTHGHDSVPREFDYSLTRGANGFLYSAEVPQDGVSESLSADMFRGVLLRELSPVPVSDDGTFAITLTFNAAAKAPVTPVAAGVSGISGPAAKLAVGKSIEIPVLLAVPPRTGLEKVLDGFADSYTKNGPSSPIAPSTDVAPVVYRRGRELSLRGKYKESLPYLARAASMTPDPQYLNSYAWSLLAAGQPEEALIPARAAAAGIKGSKDVALTGAILDTLAHAEYVNGNWARAVAAWDDVLKAQPDFYTNDLDPLCTKDLEHLADARKKAAASAPVKPRTTPGSSR
jgi:hypothetical protein